MRFLFGDYALDEARRELRHNGDVVQVEPQVFDLLVHLIRNRDHVVSKDDLLATVWRGRIVSESTLNSRINAARRAVGDSGEEQKFIRTVARRGIRFVVDVSEEDADSKVLGAAATLSVIAATPTEPSDAPPQDVSFFRTADGVNLAVATTGNGLPVVKVGNRLNHIEYDWQSPVWSPLLTRLASQFRLIRYDERGSGLSDWDVAEISFEAFVRDLEAVVNTLGLDRFSLLGISRGAPVAIAFAARHPERVSRLVLYAGHAVGWRKRSSADQIAQREAMMTLLRHGWGKDIPAFNQVYRALFMPAATHRQYELFSDLQRVSTSPDNAVRFQQASADFDVTDLLARVRARTLVLHCRGDTPTPFAQGLILARAIPNARFVPLDSNNHIVLSHEPAWQCLMDEMCTFFDAKPQNSANSASTLQHHEPKSTPR
jgi:DNA-binding winged helix-turn-helix (wHTH) protein/pimeloyl-ACP methyl ester carboxylesterase